jgi:hypothetical protein
VPASLESKVSVTLRLDLGRTLAAYKRYTRADIDHVTLKVYRKEDGAEVLTGTTSISGTALGDDIKLDALTVNSSYVARAAAYDAAGDSPEHRISVPMSSYLSFNTLDSATLSALKVPLRLVPFQPNFGHVESQFLDGMGANSSINVDGYYIYYLDGDGNANRIPFWDPTDVWTLYGPFKDLSLSPDGYVYAVNDGGGISRLSFDDETVDGLSDLDASSVAGSPEGKLYATADDANGGHVYQVDFNPDDLSGGSTLTAIAGGSAYGDGQGNAAGFNGPTSLCFAPSGDMFVFDANASSIRKVTQAGAVTTLSYTGAITDMVGLPSGDVLATNANDAVIYKVPANGDPSVIFAGFPNEHGFGVGQGQAARFESPGSIAVGPNGTIYVVDAGNDLLRRIF